MITAGRVAAGTATQTFLVPAGPATLLLANVGTASPVYAAPGTSVSSSNGFPVPSGAVSPVVVPVYPGNPAQTWSAVCSGGSASLAWIVSVPSGGTGL